MLDGRALIDVHLHPAHRAGLTVPWELWVQGPRDAVPAGNAAEVYRLALP